MKKKTSKRIFVFDFYNLYIPKGKPYLNEELGVKITPLKLAEEFENNRKKSSKPFYRGGWKTAKCFIKSDSEEIAVKIAGWLEFLYSFAQSRSVFFVYYYLYRNGKKYRSSPSKYIEPRENRSSELIYGFREGRSSNRDISPFLDEALRKLKNSEDEQAKDILITIHVYLISRSQGIPLSIGFLICWCSLEKLANKHYSVHKSKSNLFQKYERARIKKKLFSKLDQILGGDERLSSVKKSIGRNFLYEHDTYEKINIYLESLDLGFDRKEFHEILKELVEIRGRLVHNLDHDKLVKQPNLILYLKKIMENVIFRLLGIVKEKQESFLLSQYNRR